MGGGVGVGGGERKWRGGGGVDRWRIDTKIGYIWDIRDRGDTKVCDQSMNRKKL